MQAPRQAISLSQKSLLPRVPPSNATDLPFWTRNTVLNVTMSAGEQRDISPN